MSGGFNLIRNGVDATGFTAATDRTASFAVPLGPRLDPAGPSNHGGSIPTIALLCGSPAIDIATSIGLSGTLATDQRGAGFPRTFDDPYTANAVGGDGTDIGAFERQQNCLHPTFSVNTTGDAADVQPGDGICDVEAGTPGEQCTLRA